IVPWIKPQQRSFKEEDLPKGSEKRDLYEIARNILLDGGYLEIGMDHFALPSDALAVAQSNKNMHRNFMGYTDQRTDVMIGLGVSSISEAPGCFHQNEKVLPVYERELDKGNLPTLRGHLLTDSDRKHREQILEFMTNYEVPLVDVQQEEDVRNFLSELMNDDLVIVEDQKLKLTEKGRPFLRNACMALDERMRESKPETMVFSQSI
ncbi:MAG: coproporphyrinogen III oxidase, partial [Gammaproteobacteria bacterium]|nr:coproporphyrinogen III oxidase [Gammaproteobacteria bacterium]